MRKQGIAFDPAFPALHLIHSKSRFRAIGDLPNATSLHDEIVDVASPCAVGFTGRTAANRQRRECIFALKGPIPAQPSWNNALRQATVSQTSPACQLWKDCKHNLLSDH